MVLIEPTPVTMRRHYATIHNSRCALKCWRFTMDWADTCDNAVTGGEVCAYTLQVLSVPPSPPPQVFTATPLPSPPPIVIFIYPYKGSEAASLSPKQISTGSFHRTAACVQESYFICDDFHFHKCDDIYRIYADYTIMLKFRTQLFGLFIKWVKNLNNLEIRNILFPETWNI